METRTLRRPWQGHGPFAREPEFEIFFGERAQMAGTTEITAFDSASNGDLFGETKEK